MTNEEVQEIIDRAEDEYDRLKDRVHEQYDEIERLNNDIKELLKENSNKEKVIIAQDNIIKEVREYIEKNKEGTDCCGEIYIGLGEEEINDILGILDKLDKENNNE